jgi:hypothetical protein
MTLVLMAFPEPPEPPAAPLAPAPHPPDATAHPDEAKLAGSPAVVAANGAVLALTRAARSFALYDPANKVVRQLIGEYRDKARRFLDAHGALDLEVHPFELRLGPDVVYVEKDRERSLAFRLFRDGVRRLAIAPATGWEELLRLLEILSIRFTGVRQQEDDLVTLLRKAGFEGITVEAIEGFVPEEEMAESAASFAARDASLPRFDPPRQWDALPAFTESAPLRHRAVPEELLARLRAEERPEELAPLALRSVVDLLTAAASDEDRQATLAFASEVRDFLLVEGRADVLARLAAAVGQPGFVDPKAVRALLLAQPPDTADVPPALGEMLDAVGGDPLALPLELLAAEGDGPRAPFLCRLAARAAHGSIEPLRVRLASAHGAAAGALLQVAAEVEPAGALALALERAHSGDPGVELTLVSLLERAVPAPAHLAALRAVVTSGQSEAARTRAAPLLAARAGARALPLLRAHVEGRADLPAAEAEACGRAMAEAAPGLALEAFTDWLRPRTGGLVSRIVGPALPPGRQHAALGGLERLAGAEADALLKLLAEKGETSVRARAADAIAHRAAHPAGERRG